MKGRHHQELIEKTRGLAPVRTAVVHTTVCPTNTLQASCPRSSARQAPRGAWLPGSGASMCAMKQRKSVATTMGFTALDGLVVSQRRGGREGQIAPAPTDWLRRAVAPEIKRRFRCGRSHLPLSIDWHD